MMCTIGLMTCITGMDIQGRVSSERKNRAQEYYDKYKRRYHHLIWFHHLFGFTLQRPSTQ